MLCAISSYYHMIHPSGFSIHRQNGLNHYLFILFNTPTEVWVDGSWIPALNHYIVFEPNHPQWYRDIGDKPYCNDFIDFIDSSPDADGDFFKKLSIPMNTPVPCYDTDWVSQTIQRLTNVRFGPVKWRDEIAAHELMAMFYRLSVVFNAANNNTSKQYLPAFYKLRSALYLTPKSDTCINQLAASEGLSPSHFQHIYKAYFSVSVGTDIISGRLEHARHLLSNSTIPICTIAQQSGYKSTEHFIRQFKKHEGLTPGQYRRQFIAAE